MKVKDRKDEEKGGGKIDVIVNRFEIPIKIGVQQALKREKITLYLLFQERLIGQVVLPTGLEIQPDAFESIIIQREFAVVGCNFFKVGLIFIATLR
jgi:hypothetical protein